MPKEEIVTTLDEINEQIRGDADEEKVIDLDAPLDDSPPP